MPTEWVPKSLPSGISFRPRSSFPVQIADYGRLLFDGQRIGEGQTAEDLELEDGDSLEVLLERESDLPESPLQQNR